MKSYYRKCSKCGELKAYLTYFLSKEENTNLTEEEKQLCFECYKTSKRQKELATVDKNIKKLLIARSEPQETVSMRVAA